MADARQGGAADPRQRLHAVLQQLQWDLGPVHRRVLGRYPNGLDLFWYSSRKYPQSIPATPFKNYIRFNQIDINYYYNATHGAAQRDIKSALRVYAALRDLAAVHSRTNAQEFAAAYREALTKVQNDLGSQGYAPVASMDTEVADCHRNDVIERRSGNKA